MSPFEFILAALVVHRLSLLISKEDGPAFIFRKIRKLPPQKSSAKEGLSCQWCMSVWMSAAVTTWLWYLGRIPGIDWPIYWLALSSAGICINQAFTKG